MPFFLPLDHYGRADHLGRCGDVEQEGLVFDRWYQNGGVGEQRFEFGECFLSLGGPGKALRFSQETVQR